MAAPINPTGPILQERTPNTLTNSIPNKPAQTGPAKKQTHVPLPVIPMIDLTADKENQPQAASKKPTTATAATASTTANPKKRKSDVEQDIKAIMFPADAPVIDDDDPRLDYVDSSKETCQKTRRKIRD